MTYLAAATLAACSATTSEPEDAEEIASAIERENGGLDMADDGPMFGDAELFAEAAIEPDSAVADPMATDSETAAQLASPDAALYNTLVLWGQMPPDMANQDGHEWDGTISINRGAMVVRRQIGFEDETDALEPRSDRRSVSFISITVPRVDGLLLTIADPDPAAAEPLVVTYTSASGAVFSATMADLVSGVQSQPVDESGNRIAAAALPRPVDPCAHGTLRGRWHRVEPGRGRLIGVVSNPEGETIGHMRGVYGRRTTGEQVFFGKYIDLDGRFRGLFGGGYRDGHFQGRWIVRDDLDHGLLAGEYRETIDGPETGGFFVGRWAETSCNLRLDR
jgi:hypothetical protein